jgi:hypothetical protein
MILERFLAESPEVNSAVKATDLKQTTLFSFDYFRICNTVNSDLKNVFCKYYVKFFRCKCCEHHTMNSFNYIQTNLLWVSSCSV